MSKQAGAKDKAPARQVVMVLTPSGKRTMRDDPNGEVNARVFGR